jgi:hypothetical protein
VAHSRKLGAALGEHSDIGEVTDGPLGGSCLLPLCRGLWGDGLLWAACAGARSSASLDTRSGGAPRVTTGAWEAWSLRDAGRGGQVARVAVFTPRCCCDKGSCHRNPPPGGVLSRDDRPCPVALVSRLSQEPG